MTNITITDQEFSQFQRFIYEAAGISMSNGKKALVSGRLAKRLAHFQVDSYGAYFKLLANGGEPGECQMAIDLLTTNETYFFREAKHFDLLRELALAAKANGRPLRVWSAACSTGEEVYSIAMVLADVLEDRPWEVLGTDISTRVLERARRGHYPMERATQLPQPYLKRFCLKGQGAEAGTLLVERKLRARVQFEQANLIQPLPQLGMFDLIFLRNVMIYFSGDTKREVVARVLGQLKPGGHFCIGHSETLNDISGAVTPLAPSIYVKG
ncbi:MAG TPA: protein-glutamate O-methyltransferase CheR [Telluria sp.]|nr:protein-glutamate O-methyltransferase CheR [Telluria sp.]